MMTIKQLKEALAKADDDEADVEILLAEGLAQRWLDVTGAVWEDGFLVIQATPGVMGDD